MLQQLPILRLIGWFRGFFVGLRAEVDEEAEEMGAAQRSPARGDGPCGHLPLQRLQAECSDASKSIGSPEIVWFEPTNCPCCA
jgi:hypothetical protein